MEAARDPDFQRQRYGTDFYQRMRTLRWLFRYDCRYRLLLMEEVFRRHGVPFEHQRVFELGFGTGDLLRRFDTTSTLHGCELSLGAIEALRRDPRWMTMSKLSSCWPATTARPASRARATTW